MSTTDVSYVECMYNQKSLSRTWICEQQTSHDMCGVHKTTSQRHTTQLHFPLYVYECRRLIAHTHAHDVSRTEAIVKLS